MAAVWGDGECCRQSTCGGAVVLLSSHKGGDKTPVPVCRLWPHPSLLLLLLVSMWLLAWCPWKGKLPPTPSLTKWNWLNSIKEQKCPSSHETSCCLCGFLPSAHQLLATHAHTYITRATCRMSSHAYENKTNERVSQVVFLPRAEPWSHRWRFRGLR